MMDDMSTPEVIVLGLFCLVECFLLFRVLTNRDLQDKIVASTALTVFIGAGLFLFGAVGFAAYLMDRLVMPSGVTPVGGMLGLLLLAWTGFLTGYMPFLLKKARADEAARKS
jgi:multisubunit Na+/H+ antiporter MnhF subunit